MRCPLILNCGSADHEKCRLKFVCEYKMYAPTQLKGDFFRPNEGALTRIRCYGMVHRVILYPLVIFLGGLRPSLTILRPLAGLLYQLLMEYEVWWNVFWEGKTESF